MISCADISLIIDGTEILSGINWHIERGQHYVLFGRNGSGKSKLLQCITGYTYPSTGTISRFGEPHLGHDIREIRKRIGYLSGSLKEKVQPWEKAEDLILSGYFSTIGLYDSCSGEQKKKAYEMLKSIGLERRRDDPFSRFSDGEKQKILLARSLISQPELLILDEPAVNLDLGYREEFLKSLEKNFSSHETTLLYVTHHVEEILPSFTSLHIIHGGKTLFDGPVRQGLTSQMLSELFGEDLEVTKHDGRYQLKRQK